MNGLALQGGGCLGYGQVLTMAAAENIWNKPTSEVFHMISGTSVGSIVGACLATGMPASKISDFFSVSAPAIFKGNWWNRVSSLWGPKYGAEALEKALQETLGTKTLSDCRTAFIATAYDWASDRPVYFKSFEKSGANKNYIVVGPDSGIQLWQICRASSAAQTYFPAYKYNGMTLLDGGNTGDNAPDMLLLTEMLEYSDLKKVRMLSLGSGDTVWDENTESMVSPSLPRAGLETIKIVFSAGEDAQVYKASHILAGNHIRLSPDLGNGIAIDDAKECLAKIPGAVEQMLKTIATNQLSLFNQDTPWQPSCTN